MHHLQRSPELRSPSGRPRCEHKHHSIGPHRGDRPRRISPSGPAEVGRLVLAAVWGRLIAVVAGCAPDERHHTPLIERTVPPDTSALTPRIRSEGGPVLLELTGWVNGRVREEFVAAGLEPPPGYDSVEALDSMGQNVIGGTVTTETLGGVLALPYIVEVRAADVER